MKLWIKVSLIAIIMITTATGICSLIMLMQSGQSNLSLAIDNMLTDHELREKAWVNEMSKSIISTDSAVSQRSLARYLVGQYAGTNTVLVSDDDFIYNTSSINPKEYLPLQTDLGQRQYIIQDIGGKSILLVGSILEINQIQYSFFIIRDISNVYNGIQAMATQFSLINLVVIAIAGIAVILLVRLGLRPVFILKQNTTLIANGIYDRQLEIVENDEIGELASDFNRMSAAVEKHVRELENEVNRRSMFMAALTHELKTPMTSISGNAQTLLRTKLTDEECEDALIRIDEECTRIERLSQKMIKLIVLQQGKSIELTPQSVDALLEIVQASCAGQLKQRSLALNIQNSMNTLPMDIDLLSSLFINLIDNASKASGQGDTICLHAQENTITVIDYGRGIPPEEINLITQPFYMVDKSRSKKAGGIGLGLALCEEIATLHGARLEFESELGIGTIVKVVFEHV